MMVSLSATTGPPQPLGALAVCVGYTSPVYIAFKCELCL